jgi:hypothetical protein
MVGAELRSTFEQKSKVSVQDQSEQVSAMLAAKFALGG